MFPPLSKFNLQQWIDADREKWGRRRTVWEDSDFITVVHRGPTTGKQFHVNEGEEIFYQLEGQLSCHYIDSSGEREILTLNPGEMFLLPANVPHSPRRAEGSWTLVIERKRQPHEVDRWVWFCESCNNKLYEADPRKGTGPADGANRSVEEGNTKLRSDIKLSTCNRCGEVLNVDSA